MLSKNVRSPDSVDTDVTLINALASAHMQFGRLAEANDLLRLANAIDVKNLRTLELISIVSIRIGQLKMAKISADQFKKISGGESNAIKIIRRRLDVLSSIETLASSSRPVISRSI